jgi:hypothetical protein
MKKDGLNDDMDFKDDCYELSLFYAYTKSRSIILK